MIIYFRSFYFVILDLLVLLFGISNVVLDKYLKEWFFELVWMKLKWNILLLCYFMFYLKYVVLSGICVLVRNNMICLGEEDFRVKIWIVLMFVILWFELR